MKKENILNIPIVPEDYGTDFFREMDVIIIDNGTVLRLSEMASVERKFINGLMRYYEPTNILEVGVSGGGGSAVLLDAISGIEKASLTSIDLAESWHQDESRPVGFIVKEKFSELPLERWNLLLGKDPAAIIGALGKTFDFAVIDSAHVHPIEILNFLTILPFLEDGAIVVLHDTSLHIAHGLYDCLAPRILWSAVVGDKLEPRREYSLAKRDGSTGNIVCNIGAFQIGPDTRKYIRNVFESLMIPWEICSDTINDIEKFLPSYYDADLTALFKKAAGFNKVWHESGFRTFSVGNMKQAQEAEHRAYQRWLKMPVIFYGAGKNVLKVLEKFERYNLPFDFPIWDIKASEIVEVNGHKVTAPDFNTAVPNGHIAIITIADQNAFLKAKKMLEDVGFIVLSVKSAFEY